MLALSFVPFKAFAVDLTEVERQLTTTGVEGWIHGAVAQQGLYVFTYRNPTDFFDFVEMSLVSFKPELTNQLSALGRHDRVRVKGVFLDNPSPQKHIQVASIEMLKKYEPSPAMGSYSYEAKIPDELLQKRSGLFLVHAVGGDGHILVTEYKDAVVPIFVKNALLTQGLFRNDLVQLSFRIQQSPNQPTHLNLDERAPHPVQVIESIKEKHGTLTAIEGALILFPKSPEIIFNVFAVQQELPEGLSRQFTLVNFDDPAEFKRIRDALQAAWDKYPGASVNGRNKLVSTRIRVKASGTFNEVSPNQANPQILLKSLQSIEIIEN